MKLEPGQAWRPWDVDALATVTETTTRGITIRYDHDPALHTLDLATFTKIGRTVDREDYEQGKADAATVLHRIERALAEREAERARKARPRRQQDPREARLDALHERAALGRTPVVVTPAPEAAFARTDEPVRQRVRA